MDCNLYIYRMGKNPARAGIGGDIGGERGQLKMKNVDSTEVFCKNIIDEDTDMGKQDLSADKMN